MFALKGFAVHSQFANNALGVVNAIGEISTYSLTFSKEKKIYVTDDHKPITLITFLLNQDGQDVELTPTQRDEYFAIIDWMYQKTLTTGGTMYPDEILNELITTFATTSEDFKCGEIVSDGHYQIPQWLSWRSKATPDSYIRIWFVNEAFDAQYDEYEIVVVPPIDNVDDFFKSMSEVDALLKARTPSQSMDIIQDAKQGQPETILRAESYTWHNPIATAQTLAGTVWTVLIYGPAGNNIDSIKDALQKHILSHSTHTRDEWVVVFPDIFKRTEFILVPFWDHYALPNRLPVAGIYSPIANLIRSQAQIQLYAPDYPAAHINTHAAVMGHPYKSLALGSIGSIENRDNQYELLDVFPDWIAVSSTSQDFNRMSAHTRAWAELLFEMLLIAETMGPFTDIPRNYTRVVRQGLLYLVRTYDNIHYLVLAKTSVPQP